MYARPTRYDALVQVGFSDLRIKGKEKIRTGTSNDTGRTLENTVNERVVVVCGIPGFKGIHEPFVVVPER
jgi:hypothetical protein